MSLSPTAMPNVADVTDVTAITTSSSASSASTSASTDGDGSAPVSSNSNFSAVSTALSPVSAPAVAGPATNTSVVSVPLTPATAAPFPEPDAVPASTPTDDRALSFFKDEKVRDLSRTALHGDVPMIFRTHALELSIRGKHWGDVVQNHSLSSFFTSSLSTFTSSSSSSSSSSAASRPFTARVTVQYPDGATHTVHTDAVAGLNDPDFTHRIQIPALTMPDSQAFARRIVLDIVACCGGIPFAVVRNIRLVDLVWELVLPQRPMTLFVNDNNSGGGCNADGGRAAGHEPSSFENDGNATASGTATGTNTDLNSSMFLPVRRENSWREAFYRMKLGPIVLVDPVSSSSSSSSTATTMQRTYNEENATFLGANISGILQAKSGHCDYAISRFGRNTRSNSNRNFVPSVTIRVIKGCRAVPHSNHTDDTTNNSSRTELRGDCSDGKQGDGTKSKMGTDTDVANAVSSASVFFPPCIIDPFANPDGTSSSTPPSSSRCSLASASSSVTSSSASSGSPSSLGASPQLAVRSISQTPSTLRNLPLLPATEAAGSKMPNASLSPLMSPFAHAAYFSAGRLIPPLVSPSANITPCIVDNKRLIFDVTIDRAVMRHRFQTCTHLSLSTACEKGGHFALVSTGRISSHTQSSSSSSSSTSSHPSASLLAHPDSTFSCNLLCTSHALVGECLQRVCRLQTVAIDNGRRYYLGFCQFRLDHIALEHKRLVQWHMRGRQGLSTLVYVTKFVHCQSFIHVTLSIGSAATCVRRVENPSLMYEHLTPDSGRDARARTGLLHFKKRHGHGPENQQNQQSHKHRQQVTPGATAAGMTKHHGLRSSWESVKRKLHVAKNSYKQHQQHQQHHRQQKGSLQSECDDGGGNEKTGIYSVRFPSDGANLG